MANPGDYKSVDYSDPLSIEAYAKQLEGMTFRDVLNLGISPEGISRKYNDKHYKGGMGTLIEERFFGYKANSDDQPDFPEAGVELKTTCYDVKKDGDYSAGERLVLTMISFDRPIEEDFNKSHFWNKCCLLLLIYYQRNKSIDSYDQQIEYAMLFTPPEEDLKIIRDDYAKICGMVKAGRANELSESQTTYLGACTKGATAEKSKTSQFYPPYAEAKGRAFCFKRQYMDYILHQYFMGQKNQSSKVIPNSTCLEKQTFEQYVLGVVQKYKGKTDRELCREFGMPFTGKKAQWVTLTYRMLGLRDSHAEEFEKANISVRTVRAEKNGRIKECLSLDTFKFCELLDENWEDSTLRNYFEETRFFFVVFRKEGTFSRLEKCGFWSMPVRDIEGQLHECWEKTREVIREGVEITPVKQGGSLIYTNNLPGMKDNPIIHVRPHTSKRAYKFADGSCIGNVERHADLLPDGRWMTKQSFWLNGKYVQTITDSL